MSLLIGHDQSPEVTGKWRCTNRVPSTHTGRMKTCNNRLEFVGYADRSYPGQDCECGAYEDGEKECTCEVTLEQDFTVDYDDVFEGRPMLRYQAHDGGYDAEIGEYTRIECGVCGEEVWRESEVIEASPVNPTEAK